MFAVGECAIFRRNAGNETGFVSDILEQIEELAHGRSGVANLALITASATPFRFCTMQTHLTVKRANISRD